MSDVPALPIIGPGMIPAFVKPPATMFLDPAIFVGYRRDIIEGIGKFWSRHALALAGDDWSAKTTCVERATKAVPTVPGRAGHCRAECLEARVTDHRRMGERQPDLPGTASDRGHGRGDGGAIEGDARLLSAGRERVSGGPRASDPIRGVRGLRVGGVAPHRASGNPHHVLASISKGTVLSSCSQL